MLLKSNTKALTRNADILVRAFFCSFKEEREGGN